MKANARRAKQRQLNCVGSDETRGKMNHNIKENSAANCSDEAIRKPQKLNCQNEENVRRSKPRKSSRVHNQEAGGKRKRKKKVVGADNSEDETIHTTQQTGSIGTASTGNQARLNGMQL